MNAAAGEDPQGTVVAVGRRRGHHFSKDVVLSVRLLAGLGVEGDAHMGRTVKHRSRFAVDPSRPNLRQVHLLQAELIDHLLQAGFRVGPAVMGENITTRGIDLLALPRGTRLHLGPDAVIEVTGLRNPCVQLDRYQQGLTAAVLDRDPAGRLIRKAGIMAVVLRSGDVAAGDHIDADWPALPHCALEPV